jgi:hypothetical protein
MATRPPLIPPFGEAMARVAQNVIQHDFGFPRIIGSGDAELEALYIRPNAGASQWRIRAKSFIAAQRTAIVGPLSATLNPVGSS